MKKLKMKMERVEEGKKITIFESDDFDSCLSWTITALYDGAVKRCKLKIDQYYGDDGKEYCKIKATYVRPYDDVKEIYTIENWRNDWGNFINVCKTLQDNRIEIKEV